MKDECFQTYVFPEALKGLRVSRRGGHALQLGDDGFQGGGGGGRRLALDHEAKQSRGDVSVAEGSDVVALAELGGDETLDEQLGALRSGDIEAESEHRLTLEIGLDLDIAAHVRGRRERKSLLPSLRQAVQVGLEEHLEVGGRDARGGHDEVGGGVGSRAKGEHGLGGERLELALGGEEGTAQRRLLAIGRLVQQL